MTNRFGLKDLGCGVGLRSCHYDHVLERRPAVDWFEALTENYLGTGGRPLEVLERVAERYPVVLHGVSLSIGSTDPLDLDYLAEVKALADRVRAEWVGDHLCWTGVLGKNTHDLLPLPYDEPTLAHVVSRVREVQDRLERPLVLENPSTYLRFRRSTLDEAEFLARVAEEADCALLLDVNNVHVTCHNQDLDPDAYVDAIPLDRVVQIHVAGHADRGTHYLDTHGAKVCGEAWRLYRRVLERGGPRATLLEWDQDVPPFERLEEELAKAVACRAEVVRA